MATPFARELRTKWRPTKEVYNNGQAAGVQQSARGLTCFVRT